MESNDNESEFSSNLYFCNGVKMEIIYSSDFVPPQPTEKDLERIKNYPSYTRHGCYNADSGVMITYDPN